MKLASEFLKETQEKINKRREKIGYKPIELILRIEDTQLSYQAFFGIKYTESSRVLNIGEAEVFDKRTKEAIDYHSKELMRAWTNVQYGPCINVQDVVTEVTIESLEEMCKQNGIVYTVSDEKPQSIGLLQRFLNPKKID